MWRTCLNKFFKMKLPTGLLPNDQKSADDKLDYLLTKHLAPRNDFAFKTPNTNKTEIYERESSFLKFFKKEKAIIIETGNRSYPKWDKVKLSSDSDLALYVDRFFELLGLGEKDFKKVYQYGNLREEFKSDFYRVTDEGFIGKYTPTGLQEFSERLGRVILLYKKDVFIEEFRPRE